MSSQWVMVVKDARDAKTVSSEISAANESASDVHPTPTAPDRQPDAWAYFRDLSTYFGAGGDGAQSLKATVWDAAIPATTTITFSLIATGDTVTVGDTVFTGDLTPTLNTEFQTNAVPSGAADIVAAASLAAKINAHPDTSELVSATSSGAVITVTVLIPGTLGNFLPVAISDHGVIAGASTGPNATLLTASTYAALAKSAISNTGNTVLNGDLGLSPGTSVTGFPPGVISGTYHITDAAAAQAQVDASAAAVALQATGPGTDISATDLGGYVATPGTYSAAAAGTWTAGALTLNGAGTYIFLFGTSLTLPANASIVLNGGATADNVYFVTGTTFVFGAVNTTYGNILAGTAITTASLTNHTGRLLIYGASGTAITFPSAAVVTNPSFAAGLSGGSQTGYGSVAEGII